jgi:hypothetical protein
MAKKVISGYDIRIGIYPLSVLFLSFVVNSMSYVAPMRVYIGDFSDLEV